mmetsp:Transcript_30640/g.46919  ORF Transcript_30640/g.46919 Transcript_30640/m.46919 type:complete len:245 (-) Transcript_30640:64-798(-)
MERTIVCKTSTQSDRNCSKGQGVECLSTHFFQTISLSLNPKDRPNSGCNEDNSSNSNAQEQETTNDTFSNTTWTLCHDTILCGFDGSNKTKCHCTDQVTVQDLDRSQGGIFETTENSKQNTHSLCVIDRCVDEKDLAKIVPHHTSFTNCSNNCGKIIISKNHFGRFTSYICSFFAHGNTHIGCFQCGCIVHTISRHTAHFSLRLKGLDNLDLVLRRGTSENVVQLSFTDEFLVGHSIKFWTRDC